MPIGIIIIAVIGVACFIAAKCCGVHIDPLGWMADKWNELRNRWVWLDTQLNKFDKFKREKNYRNYEVLYVETDGMEPYYQPKSYAPSYGSVSLISSLREDRRNSNTDTVSILTSELPPPTSVPKRLRPTSLNFSRQVPLITQTTLTPITPNYNPPSGFVFPEASHSAIRRPKTPSVRTVDNESLNFEYTEF
ncbi:Oidioi.mRNA.OKI2018_I69.chr2.g4202.t1.cds [Oikopleura dioica]|uniref:Oidioi.mRNA.OKI2018_I69.chr2.g4202.t1.cds n=1 Tax=Oikopleura dioica TaxID=34765 RepID=A0ABN7T375_OIKDI|nr:Oidioi.mRNA.OKI2018_I69.chr2.g4202.t1.cds [Oikopleura dioica]